MKEYRLKEYIESMGYTMDEVMVLGDSLNDYSMLEMDFGATIAMENAEETIVEAEETSTRMERPRKTLGTTPQSLSRPHSSMSISSRMLLGPQPSWLAMAA